MIEKQGSSAAPLGGWLVLKIGVGRAIELETKKRVIRCRARIAVISTDPLTLQLSVPLIGVFDISIEPYRNWLRVAVRAHRSVQVRRR